MRLPFLYSRTGTQPAKATQQQAAAPSKSVSLKSLLLLSTALCTLVPSAMAQTTVQTRNFTIYDEAGNAIGQPFTVQYDLCTPIIGFTMGLTYATIKSDDPRAALNLYAQEQCQLPTSSSVGSWPNTGLALNTLAVRWEGTAPTDRATGELNPVLFPPRLEIQKNMNAQWAMDPSKGIVIVGIVSGVLVIGVAIGLYQVYVAAQFKPPPKKQKKPKTGLNIKKVKKKDAYYRKPVRTDDPAPFQRLHNDSLDSYAGAGGRPPALAMTEQSRDSQSTFVDWNNQNQQRSSPLGSQRKGSDSVSIDMRDTLGNNNNNNNNSNRSPFANSYSPDLIQFDGSTGRGYGQGQNQPYRGRGGEVLVPMDTLDHHHNHNNNHNNNNQYNNNGRSGVRRTSSGSRSR
ncbi:hypothetical protein BGX33_002671 [Mortierella sp. NVP41]|nr:hypothetical protein BGX33_002671 [Mortierella sp. NVP41]